MTPLWLLAALLVFLAAMLTAWWHDRWLLAVGCAAGVLASALWFVASTAKARHR